MHVHERAHVIVFTDGSHILQELEGLQRFWLGHSWAGLRGGGGGAEQ